MPGFKNRLHEQLARRTARDAFRHAAGDGSAVDAVCEPCELTFSGVREQELSDQLEAHYKTAEHRRSTNITIQRQRAERND